MTIKFNLIDAKKFCNKNEVLAKINTNDLIIFAQFKKNVVGYILYSKKQNTIKEIFVNEEFRNSKIGTSLVHNIILLNNNVKALNLKETSNFFRNIGFEFDKNNLKLNPEKLDLKYNFYIIKKRDYWYCSYTDTLIKIKKSEILKNKSKLFELGFLIPLHSNYVTLFEYLHKDIQNKCLKCKYFPICKYTKSKAKICNEIKYEVDYYIAKNIK